MANFYCKRSLDASIIASFERAFISVILGPRRVGKSTLITHYANQHANRHWVFLNLDNMLDRQRIEQGELLQLIEERALFSLSALNSTEKLWVAIDEAQKCPALFEQLKILYDQYKDQNKIKFILTGSATLTLHQLSAETLAGRIEVFHLRTFSLREAAALQHRKPIPTSSFFAHLLENKEAPGALPETFFKSIQPYNQILKKTLNELLVFGSFPEVILHPQPTEKTVYLRNYIQTYLEKDVRAIPSVSDLNLYQRLMEIMATQTGAIREDTRILQALGCSRETLKKYRGYLGATLLYEEIYPYIDSALKRLVKSPKCYLIDNGIISFFTGITTLEQLEHTGLIGHRLENWFLNELHILLEADATHHQVYYWRTSAGAEVDFIVKRQGAIYPFEVTVTKTIDSKKIKNLKSFMESEKQAKCGFYVYGGEYRYDSETNIHFLPAWLIG